MILVTATGAPLEPSGILYVDADETSKPVPSPGVVLSSFIAPAENAMATDPGAWLPIVLWGQLLLLIAIALSWLWTALGKWQTWIIAVPAVGFRWFHWNPILAFWFAYVVTRPLGASFADWMGKARSVGGLGWGDGTVALALTAAIAGLVTLLGVTHLDVKKRPHMPLPATEGETGP